MTEPDGKKQDSSMKTPKRPIDLLEVGQFWGDGPGDTLMRVHKLDREGGRCQLRVAAAPPPGKRWDINRGIKRGMTVKIRRLTQSWCAAAGTFARVAIEGDVTSAMNTGVTITNLRYAPWDKAETEEGDAA